MQEQNQQDYNPQPQQGQIPQPVVGATTNQPVPQQQYGMPSGQIAVPLPAAADDIDLIEKEWVIKAKQIVDHTSGDPYLQQAQISKMKADYMKKRYNRDIQVAED